MLPRTQRILQAAQKVSKPTSQEEVSEGADKPEEPKPSCSTANVIADEPRSTGDESNPFADLGESYKPSGADQPEEPKPSCSTANVVPDDSQSSGDESDPFADSGESYQPSTSEESSSEELCQDVNEKESSSENEDDDGPVTTTPVGRAGTPSVSAAWGPCGIVTNNFQYTGQGGFQINPNDFTEPYKIYRYFLDDQVLDLIADETNRFAAQYIQTHELSRRSLARAWTDTSADEIRQLFGILLIMGINHLPKMRLYWSRKKLYRN